MKPRRPPDDLLFPDTPLVLSIAAEIAFPDGSVKEQDLRDAWRQGNLSIEHVGGRDYTTLRSIDRMRKRATTGITGPSGHFLPHLPDDEPLPAQCVYVVGFALYVKIGWTSQLGARLYRFQHGLPEKLRVYHAFPEATQDFEKKLLMRFKALRLRGEWFRLADELEAWIAAGCPHPDLGDLPA